MLRNGKPVRAPRIDMNKISASVVSRYATERWDSAIADRRAKLKQAIMDILESKDVNMSWHDLLSKRADRILDLFDVRHDRPLR